MDNKKSCQIAMKMDGYLQENMPYKQSQVHNFSAPCRKNIYDDLYFCIELVMFMVSLDCSVIDIKLMIFRITQQTIELMRIVFEVAKMTDEIITVNKYDTSIN